jgi:alpha-beta hydrolase superfamily lysophospholipase
MEILIPLLVVIALIGTVVLLFAVKLGRRIVIPGKPKYVRVLGMPRHDVVRLEATPSTLTPGIYGLWFDGSHGHARIGKILTTDPTTQTVEREVLAVSGADLSHAETGRWSGHVFRDAHAIDPNSKETHLPVENGYAPAWLFQPANKTTNTTWAIHIHGLHTSRVTALRSVPAANEMGFTSLVVSFRGDGDAPPTPHNASMLGQHEWVDVDAAVSYAARNGATEIVLFGWSMGAGIALLLTEHSAHRNLIKKLVLIAPATNWRTIIDNGIRRKKLPNIVTKLAIGVLSGRVMSRIVGIPEPIDFDALNWSNHRRLTVPTLIIHSDGDTEIPLSHSRRFVAANPQLLSLEIIPGAPHAMEYNISEADFRDAITRWVQSTQRPNSSLEDHSSS